LDQFCTTFARRYRPNTVHRTSGRHALPISRPAGVPPPTLTPSAHVLPVAMTDSRRKLGLLLGFAGMCLFAGTLPATRLAVADFNPLFLPVARATLAGSAGLIVLCVTRRRVPERGLWPEIIGAASCTVLGFPLFAALAMMSVPAAHGGVVLGILPLATAAAAAVLAQEQPSRGFWLASAA